MTRTLSICLSLLVLSASAAAQDDDELPPPPPPPDEAIGPSSPPAPEPEAGPVPDAGAAGDAQEQLEWSPPAAEAEGVRTHDGFQLRMALGFGAVSDTITAEIGSGALKVTLDGKASGGSVAGHLAIAGEIAEGLFLGGALMSERVTSPQIEFAGMSDWNVEVGFLGMLGVIIDWYPDARGGFHLGGSIAGARISTTDEAGNMSDTDEDPAGGAGVFFIGYDFWVGEQWSLGGLARFTGATLESNLKHELGAASILFSATYN